MDRVVTSEETRTEKTRQIKILLKVENLIILLTQLPSSQYCVAHLIHIPITLWLAPITAESRNLNLWFLDDIVWPVVDVVAGPGATWLGQAFSPVEKLTVLLIFSTVAVWMLVTFK